MRPARPSRTTVIKYVLLQLPPLALLVLLLLLVDHWLQLSPALFWGIVLAWIAKDALLFPFVWRAYQPAPAQGHHKLIGLPAVAVEELAPTGYARIAGELWACRLEAGGRAPAGCRLIVTEIDGLTLIVHPEGPEPL